MHLLQGAVRTYEWGDVRAIPELRGRPVTGEPVAEYWLGTHPLAPTRCPIPVGASASPAPDTLAVALDLAGDDLLGSAHLERFGTRLPFLLKLLAANRALSIQVHPDAATARAGFDRENAAGIDLDDPRRTFKDPWHKPEMVTALSEFEVLCGFADPALTAPVLHGAAGAAAELGRPEASGLLREWAGALDSGATAEAGLAAALRLLFSRQDEFGALGSLLPELLEVAGNRDAASLTDRLAVDYPGDVGVCLALLLNHLRLAPGESLALEAGVPHAYVHGLAVEIMASSDNVVRGGLTSKHVDPRLLCELVDYRPGPPPVVPAGVDGPAVADFALHRFAGGTELIAGPAIVLCTKGAAELRATAQELPVLQGQAAFIGHAEGPVTVTGSGELFIATSGPSGA